MRFASVWLSVYALISPLKSCFPFYNSGAFSFIRIWSRRGRFLNSPAMGQINGDITPAKWHLLWPHNGQTPSPRWQKRYYFPLAALSCQSRPQSIVTREPIKGHGPGPNWPLVPTITTYNSINPLSTITVRGMFKPREDSRESPFVSPALVEGHMSGSGRKYKPFLQIGDPTQSFFRRPKCRSRAPPRGSYRWPDKSQDGITKC